MNGRLEGRVAIVSGATRQMGSTIARRLVADGATVACFGRSTQAGEAVAADIRQRGGTAIFVTVDLVREEDIRTAIARVVGEFGRLDVMVNNAAATDVLRGAGERPVVDEPTEIFDHTMKVNLYGPFWMAKYGIPEMIKSGRGSIINVSSMSAYRVDHSMPAYVASKAGLDGLTRQIANDYAAHNIRVNSIGLGPIRHTETAYLFDDPLQSAARTKNRMIAEPGKPEDLANLVAFLASDESAFITAAVIPLDGGAMGKYPAPPLTSTPKPKS